MDSFTKWAEAFPLRNKEAETIARLLVEQDCSPDSGLRSPF